MEKYINMLQDYKKVLIVQDSATMSFPFIGRIESLKPRLQNGFGIIRINHPADSSKEPSIIEEIARYCKENDCELLAVVTSSIFYKGVVRTAEQLRSIIKKIDNNVSYVVRSTDYHEWDRKSNNDGFDYTIDKKFEGFLWLLEQLGVEIKPVR